MLRRAALILLVLAACGGRHGTTPPPADAPSADANPGADAAPDAAISDLDRLRALVAALPGAADDTARKALVDTFFHDVAYAGGFPIVEGGQLGVAYYDDAAQGGAFTLAGDFNGWDASALPLVQPVAGFPFYDLITPVAPPAARSLYKLVHDGTTYLADPHARRFGFDQYGQYSLLAADATTSHLERWPDVAAAGLAPREVDVYVPAGYVGGTAHYPVLYLHDGQNLFDPAGPYGSWKAGDAADQGIASGAIRPVILVGIWNTAARMDEYTQTTDDIPDHVGGEAAQYAQLVDGVVALVDARYRTLADAAHRGVLGSSLGGLVSAYLAVVRPQTFGFAGSMSGTFGWGSIGASDHNPTLMELAAANPPTGTRFYLDSGGGPGSGCVDSDHDGVDDDTADAADNYCETLDFRATLVAHGWTLGDDLVYAYVANATHDEASWAARLPGALHAWFPGPP